ncbi:superinfection immunity protein [Chryseobacterium sp. MEBOG07]|uniref:superinfection immunity protein n=1 Tax=Chryseobacterium sp. MEBOG07 TaxID=2879939 RepID=UPI001F3BD768|nr:superinfection immunity protein [Chryseobacterium sp. MEBOG07]UKB78314.1 superinfection immunity protein [Chryseobacterium sp. MEBOG07]
MAFLFKCSIFEVILFIVYLHKERDNNKIIYKNMLATISSTSHSSGDVPLFKIIVFIYFIPSLIALLRCPIIKFKFFSVLFINLFFGWTVYGWWLAFSKAFSSRNVVYIKNKSQYKSMSTKYDQLNTLNNLRTSGAITEEEFEIEKKKILDQYINN